MKTSIKNIMVQRKIKKGYDKLLEFFRASRQID